MLDLVIVDYLLRIAEFGSNPHIQPHIIDTWPWWQAKNQDCRTTINIQHNYSIISHKQGGTSRTVKIL